MEKFSLLVLYLFASILVSCTTSYAMAEVPSTRLANYQVVDLNGDSIAQVEDVLIAADNGQISYAIVILQEDPFSYDKAAFINASVSRTAVPWDYFVLDSSSKQLHLKVDKSILYGAPLLMDKPNHLERNWDADIRAYWQAYPIPSNHEQTT